MFYFTVVLLTLLLQCFGFFLHQSYGIRQKSGNSPNQSQYYSIPTANRATEIHPELTNIRLSEHLCRSTTYVYVPRPRRSRNSILVPLLLLLGGIEPNPGPASSRILNIGSLNSRSAINKAALIHTLISDESLDILALSETWTATDDPPAIIQDIAPDGYHAHHTSRPTSRPGQRGGGLATLVSNRINSRILSISSLTTTFENQCVKLNTDHTTVILVNIYRPSSTSLTALFYDQLSDYLSEICSTQSSPVILCGDYNCPGNKPGTITKKLEDILDSHNFTQHVHKPTRQNNLLDILATNTPHLINSTSVISSHNISDHSLVKSSLNLTKPRPPTVTNKWRPLKHIDFSLLEHSLSTSELITNPASDIDDYIRQIDSVVLKELDKIAPERIVKRAFRPLPSDIFLSKEAVAAKKKRRRLERLWNRTGCDTIRKQYRDACRTCNKLINDSRTNYLSSKIRDAQENCKQKWRNLRNLLHNTRADVNQGLGLHSQSFINSLATFFHDKITKLHASCTYTLGSLVPNPLTQDKPYTGPPLTSFTPVTPPEVRRLLSSTTLKFSPLDSFPSSIIKSCPNSFSIIISTLANLSFSQGSFPSCYKLGQITPILKKTNQNPDNIENYRPISNLHTISKILERLALTRLQPFILSTGNFNPFQSAYRKYHSTETCTLKTLTDIYKSIDSGASTLLVALDLSAAFDTVSHEILLARLKHSFGISDTVLQWITSYLSSRSQFVMLSGFKSPITPLMSGVPQGSVLGPLLFAIYTSPVSNLVSSFGLSQQQYADDTQIYITVNKSSTSISFSSIESCLSSLCLWYAHNNLCINPSKSECIIFSTSTRLQKLKSGTSQTISVSGSSVKISDSITTLGTVLDPTLSLSPHVKSLVKSCNYHIRAIKHIRHILTQQDTRTLATSLVQSKLDYCNSLLYHTSSANVRALQRIQNSLARLVLQPSKPIPTAHLIKQLHWLPVKKRITYKIATLTHNAIHLKQPSYLHELLKPYQPISSLRSSEKSLLITPRTFLHLTDRSFHTSAPTIWNSLPLNLRNESDILRFRKNLKTYLFDAPPDS